MRGRLVAVAVAMGWLGFACQPLVDRCEVAARGEPVALDEVGAPGFAPADELVPEGTFDVVDGDLRLTVTLDWDDQATPRRYRWVDEDGDGVVPKEECPADYALSGTLSVAAADGSLRASGTARTAVTSGGGTLLWVVDDEARGELADGRETWLELYPAEDGTHFAVSTVRVSGESELLVDVVLE